jgi:hypothetical protein
MMCDRISPISKAGSLLTHETGGFIAIKLCGDAWFALSFPPNVVWQDGSGRFKFNEVIAHCSIRFFHNTFLMKIIQYRLAGGLFLVPRLSSPPRSGHPLRPQVV